MDTVVARVEWNGKMKFTGTGPSGHGAPMDTTAHGGGEDSTGSPKEMLLHALGGCTGMDVIAILRKMNHVPHEFEVIVSGALEPEVPRAFKSFHLDYRFEGEGLPLDALERAVTLSQEKYCSVSATLRCCRPVSWSITVNGETLKASADSPGPPQPPG